MLPVIQGNDKTDKTTECRPRRKMWTGGLASLSSGFSLPLRRTRLYIFGLLHLIVSFLMLAEPWTSCIRSHSCLLEDSSAYLFMPLWGMSLTHRRTNSAKSIQRSCCFRLISDCFFSRRLFFLSGGARRGRGGWDVQNHPIPLHFLFVNRKISKACKTAQEILSLSECSFCKLDLRTWTAFLMKTSEHSR